MCGASSMMLHRVYIHLVHKSASWAQFCIDMETSENNDSELKTTSGQAYLDKDFGVELNYKLWTTKGSRFVASKRLKTINKLSSYSIGFLSAYVIIINLISVFRVNTVVTFTADELAFITTGLSIVILVFSQLETANDFRLRAEKFHDCRLEISELYNQLRYLKTNVPDIKERDKGINELSINYGKILKRYENHEPIDFDYFKTSKNDYFELKWYDIVWINIRYYFLTMFLYHVLILVPIGLFILNW